MDLRDLYIVIVNYNSDNYLTQCVRSIFVSHEGFSAKNIVVVDNLSNDGSIESCRLKYPHLTYIYATQNTGFAKGANTGARRALEKGASYVVFVNPDALILPGCLAELKKTLLQSPGITSPLIRKPTGELWFAAGEINIKKQKAIHTTPHPIPDQPYPCEYISGCVMAVHQKTFEKIGLFDEKFFLYYEDADYSVRTRKAGLMCTVSPQAHAIHAEISEDHNGPSDQKIYFLVLSGLLFFDKHTPFMYRFAMHFRTTCRYFFNLYKLFMSVPHAQAVRYAFQDFNHAKQRTDFISHRSL